jgi:hypothetical protein
MPVWSLCDATDWLDMEVDRVAREDTEGSNRQVDALLEAAPPIPEKTEKCTEGHQWHLLPGNPKFSAYCKHCGARSRKGRTKRRDPGPKAA